MHNLTTGGSEKYSQLLSVNSYLKVPMSIEFSSDSSSGGKRSVVQGTTGISITMGGSPDSRYVQLYIKVMEYKAQCSKVSLK